jgi:sec-independent protein translocase protein TatB
VLGLSPVRLLIVAVVGLILVGPDKLPQYARQAGAAWKSLRSVQQRVEDEIRTAVPDLPRSVDLARYARSPISLLNQLADRAEADERKASAANGDAPDDEEPTAAYVPESDEDQVVRDPDRPPLSWGDPSLN